MRNKGITFALLIASSTATGVEQLDDEGLQAFMLQGLDAPAAGYEPSKTRVATLQGTAELEKGSITKNSSETSAISAPSTPVALPGSTIVNFENSAIEGAMADVEIRRDLSADRSTSSSRDGAAVMLLDKQVDSVSIRNGMDQNFMPVNRGSVYIDSIQVQGEIVIRGR